MTKKTAAETVTKPTIRVNAAPTSYSDRVSIATRTDGQVFLQFIFEMPDASYMENFRTMIGKDTAVNLIDILSKATGHYPSKPSEPKAKKSVPAIKTK